MQETQHVTEGKAEYRRGVQLTRRPMIGFLLQLLLYNLLESNKCIGYMFRANFFPNCINNMLIASSRLRIAAGDPFACVVREYLFVIVVVGSSSLLVPLEGPVRTTVSKGFRWAEAATLTINQ
jgi:hypothetical protein